VPRNGIYQFNRVEVPNDPAALPSAGGSLRALDLARDYETCTDGPNDRRVCLEALLPVAAGLESLVIHDSWISPAEAARLAAALPRDMARLRVKTRRNDIACAVLPVTSVEGGSGVCPTPAGLARLAGASRLERLVLHDVTGAAPAAMAAVLRASPRLRTLQLGTEQQRAFDLGASSTGGSAMPSAASAEASDAFVAAAARLPSLQHLSLTGFYVGGEANAALIAAAPRLSALRLVACGLSAEAAAGLAAQLRAAAGRGALSARRRQPGQHEWRYSAGYGDPLDGTAAPLDIRAGALPHVYSWHRPYAYL
jgi:hypothetical protein